MISAIHCSETYNVTRKTCTRHTANPTSYAGAKGCMQFMPNTFTHYSYDGDQNGVHDINNCIDSIWSSGNYLSQNYWKVKNKGWSDYDSRRQAFLRYNNADWYADRAENIFNQL